MTIKISALDNVGVVVGNTILPMVSNLSGTLTTVQGNIALVKEFILDSAGLTDASANIANLQANVTTLFGNAVSQQNKIGTIEANVASLFGNAVSQQNSIVDITSGVATFGNIVPSANLTYNLGSSTMRWKDLYLSGNTIHLGDSIISTGTTGTVSFSGGLASSGSIKGVIGLQQDNGSFKFHDGIYTFGYPFAGDERSDEFNLGPGGYLVGDAYAQAVVNIQSGNYVFDAYNAGQFGSPEDAIGSHTIPGDKLGGATPANDLTYSIADAHVNPDGTDTIYLTAAEVGIFAPSRPAVLAATVQPDGTLLDIHLHDAGLGYPQDIEFDLHWGGDALVTHINNTNVIEGHLTNLGSITTNTYIYSSAWYVAKRDVTVTGGTPVTDVFFPGPVVTLPVTPRVDSTLTITYGWTAGRDTSDYYYETIGGYNTIVLDSGSWNLIDNTLTLTLDSALISADKTARGYVWITESNDTTLNILPGTYGPYTEGHYTINDYGFSSPQGAPGSIRPTYSLTLDGSGYAESVSITNRGAKYGFTRNLSVVDTDTYTTEVILTPPVIGVGGYTVLSGIVEPAATITDLTVTGKLTVDGTLTVGGETYISLTTLKTAVATSIDFADFKTKIADL